MARSCWGFTAWAGCCWRGLSVLIIAGMDRRKVSKGMTSFREKTDGLTNGFLTALGSYLIVLFGGALLYQVVTL